MKESFNVKSPAIYGNDFSGCPDDFKSAALSVWDKAMVAADRYALAAALALGLEADFFTSKLKLKDMVTCRFLHYPPCDYSPGAAQGHGSVRIGEHTDFGLFTFLFIEGRGEGLEVKRVEAGEVGGAAGGEHDSAWKAINGIGGCTFLVNTGALFSRWTNDTWRATAHRVVVPSAEVAAVHRYSIAIFVDPDADEEVKVDGRFGDAKYPPCTSREYIGMKLEEANQKN